ncbi:RNA-directed DNA polymerase, eukaryota [Tanacetum coccineum]
MTRIINHWHGEVVVMRDFNEVRFVSKRHVFTFYASNAAEFNTFITNSHLIDVPLGGYSFTWSDKHASKMSKLDRFLISDGLLDLFPNLSGLILHCRIFDHKPIILKESHMDYGLTPFCLFHSWFLEQDLAYVVEDSWNNDGVHASNAMIFLKNKLKSLKQTLKTWSIQKRVPGITIVEFSKTIYLRLTRVSTKDSVKWATEGDENSKFFHGIINKKRRQQAIKGILLDGEWIDNPDHVKREFYNPFANIFSAPDWSRVPMKGIFPRPLGVNSSHDLEGDISVDEIKKAVWDFRDLRQGDPLLTFLFLLVMESLHVAFQRVIDRGMFVPILVEKNDLVPISHLFYADDAMFIVAANMVRINSWNGFIQKVTIKLSKWKAKSLSVGGRKIFESPWGSLIPIGYGDGDVNRFPDGDGDGDGDEAEKRGWGWLFNLDLQKDASVAQKFQNPDFAVSF